MACEKGGVTEGGKPREALTHTCQVQGLADQGNPHIGAHTQSAVVIHRNRRLRARTVIRVVNLTVLPAAVRGTAKSAENREAQDRPRAQRGIRIRAVDARPALRVVGRLEPRHLTAKLVAACVDLDGKAIVLEEPNADRRGGLRTGRGTRRRSDSDGAKCNKNGRDRVF